MLRGRRRLARATLLAATALALAAGPAWQLVAPRAASAQRADRFAYSYEFADDVDRSSAVDLIRALGVAEDEGAALLIVRLDTPGGEIEATRKMIKAMIAAPVPVAVYVHPGGSRAGSAGFYLTMAADVAAMAPGTNIGSATPLILGAPPARGAAEERLRRDLQRKVLNDSVAFARTLAEDHDRNAALAERVVRDAVNVSATSALQLGLVDLVASDERDLVMALDGFQVKGRKAGALDTAELEVKPLVLAEEPAVAADEVDRSSFVRSLGVVVGVLVVTGVGGMMLARGSPFWRRRRWLYRRWRSSYRHRR